MYSSEKDAIQKQIDEAFKKYEGEAVPCATRGPALRKVADANAAAEPEEEDEADVEDLMPRVDISAKLTDELINQIG